MLKAHHPLKTYKVFTFITWLLCTSLFLVACGEKSSDSTTVIDPSGGEPAGESPQPPTGSTPDEPEPELSEQPEPEPEPEPEPPVEPTMFTVDTAVSGSGSINPANTSAAEGDSAEFEITPDEGFQLESVEGCDGTTDGNIYTTSAISSACTINVIFRAEDPPQYGGSWPITQSSQRAAEWGFDFVEEFDGLSDWDQSGCRAGGGARSCGNRYADDPDSALMMPRLLNGDPSPWGYFSIWNTIPSAAPWIGDTSGGRQVWRGDKSLTIDIGESNLGPSRLGVYFANGGYQDFRLFYMLWIPRNMFPTSCETRSCSSGGLGVYTEGQPYTYYASWKFNTFNMDCGSVHCTARNNTYGAHSTVPQIKQFNYTPNGLLIMNANYSGANEYATEGGTTLNDYMGSWWGVEFHIRNVEDGAAYLMDIWTYDQTGVASHVMRDHEFSINADAFDGVWDQFFFGGNNAGSWDWGPTMVSHYYIDDFIVDAGEKGQIGPRYFSAIQE